jgi:hypothetical protein
LDFNQDCTILIKFLELNEDLEINQNYFKRILFKISEIYPSNFNYIEKILSIIKQKIKPETLNDLCFYYQKVFNLFYF